MRSEIDLALLRDALVRLEETTYFNSQLHEFTQKLVAVIGHVLDSRSTYSAETIFKFATLVRTAHRYLEGSTTKDAPYEIEYCLKTLLPSWVKRDAIITTALTADTDFHFQAVDPWAFVRTIITGFDAGGYDPSLVLIGVPRLYAHRPLYCIPLYHELGHYIDSTLGIISISQFLHPLTSGNPGAEMMHRREHFADLFAACCVGQASVAALELLAPNHPATFTHPSTASRIALVRDFLAGTSNGLVNLFQASLTRFIHQWMNLRLANVA